MERALQRRLAIILSVLISFSGCVRMGPKMVPQDRFRYNMAISNSWKEQTLLNIVKIRYADMPLFVEIVSAVNGYTLESTLNVGSSITLDEGSVSAGDILNLGAGGKYTDRPTITYAPITGQQFNKSFMTPIPPRAVLFLMQSGWSVDLIFPLTVDSINGLRSQVVAGANQREGDTKYYRVIELLREIQKSGATGMRIQEKDEGDDATILFFHKEVISPEIEAALNEANELLGLKSEARELNVSYGFVQKNDAELAMLTRSMLQIMINLAIQVRVPPKHVEEGRTIPSQVDTSADEVGSQRLIDIKYSEGKPDDAFVSVKYRDHWFWIDDRDFYSKRTFTFLMILFSLTETGGKEGMPLVTIPAS